MMKIGMVGVGNISGIYLKNIHELFREIELVGICDLIPEKAERAKEQYPNLKIYKDMYEMFLDKEIDIILNITRPYQHFEVSKQALLHGKHVYSEKPLAATFEEGKELVRIAEEKGLMIGGAPDTFLGAGIQTCRKIIDSGIIGKPIGAAGFMLSRGPEPWHPDPEFFYKFGGGPMFDMGPYYVTALVNLLGGVKSVTGAVARGFDKRIIGSGEYKGQFIDVEVDTFITGIMEFESGAIGTLTTTFDVINPGCHNIEIYGSEGTLIVPDPNCFDGDIIVKHLKDEKESHFPLMFDYNENSRALGLADMAKALETGRAPRGSYKQTLHVLEIMESFITSGRKRETVDLETKYTREMPMVIPELKGILD
ncbi:MAG: Gfo/Idh/MocA family oxidoreductase [Ruminococcaceae bacterium]|nr:Gfo/Idh/MocA family oxidoreductase [Oscillospiraceae bacterium]